jgi:predicted phosphodiesterase
MKIAVLSDVHGNLPALEAVLEDIARWGAERVVVNGDLINRGPNSLAVDEALRRAYPAADRIQGNHETYVLGCAEPELPRGGPEFEMRRFAHWTYAQLGRRMCEVALWRDHLDLADLEGGALHITHGSRLGNRDGIGPRTTDDELPAKLGDRRDLFVASHTHWPLIREFDGILVVNTGSVGSPFDRDPRAAYARLTFSRGRWRAEIIRLAYDRAQTERDYLESGFLDGGGPLARVMLAELRLSRGLMGPWNGGFIRR